MARKIWCRFSRIFWQRNACVHSNFSGGDDEREAGSGVEGTGDEMDNGVSDVSAACAIEGICILLFIQLNAMNPKLCVIFMGELRKKNDEGWKGFTSKSH